MANEGFSEQQLEIVRFCAVECEMQRSGEASVAGMVGAWQYALRANARNGDGERLPTVDDITALGRLVEPKKNQRGYRRVEVYVGDITNLKLGWRYIGGAMDKLLAAATDLAAGAWFHEYENIHPFVDGNGRTGQILFNWLSDSLLKPQWAPNFWNDPRRVPGRGA